MGGASPLQGSGGGVEVLGGTKTNLTTKGTTGTTRLDGVFVRQLSLSNALASKWKRSAKRRPGGRLFIDGEAATNPRVARERTRGTS